MDNFLAGIQTSRKRPRLQPGILRRSGLLPARIQGGSFALEWVATFPWNGWQLSRGMGGSFRLESVATLLWNTQGTRKSSISRLESFNTDHSPRLATIKDYARVLGYATRVDFEPIQAGAPHSS
jgi:hypothetical protein